MASIGIGWRHPHYRELVARLPALDFLEVHSENFFADGGAALAVLQQGRSHYDVSLHGVGLSLGSACGLDDWHLERLARLAERIEPVRVSDHASFARGHVAKAGSQPLVHAADLLPIPFSTEALDVLCANVGRVQDRLRRRFMVENLSAYIRWKPQGDSAPGADRHNDAPAEARFLSELARRSGCLLLVDVNNIYVNALNDTMAANPGASPDTSAALAQCRAWLDAIPPDAVGELHVAGHQWVDDDHGRIAIDDHGSRVCAEVWQLYQHAIARFGQVPTLVEWDTAVPPLDVLLGEAAQARQLAEQAAQAAHLATHAGPVA